MIHTDEFVMQHDEYDPHTGHILEGDNEKMLLAKARDLSVKFDAVDSEAVDIYISGSVRARETAELIRENLGRRTTLIVMGELDPKLEVDSPWAKQELYRDFRMIRDVGHQATKGSGALAIAHMQHVIALANLPHDAHPHHGDIYPITQPDSLSEPPVLLP